MSLGIFDHFTQMIDGLAAQAIPQALDLHCKTLEEDLKQNRLPQSEEACSILSFRQFMRLAELGQAMRCTKPFPAEHIKFYKETIVRLVQAGLLPAVALEQFDYTFANPG